MDRRVDTDVTDEPDATADATGAPPAERSGPPAGWYVEDGSGRQRWWDGQEWGVYAPPSSSSPSDGSVIPLLAHLSFFLAAILAPGIMLAVVKDDEDAQWHAREALNFQITFFILWFGMFIVGFVTVFAEIIGASPDPGAPPIPFFVMIALAFPLMLGAMGMSVYAAVKAYRGERWRYPLCLRLFKGDSD